MNLNLKVIEGPNRGKTFTFGNHDVFVVGRSPEVHFPLLNDPFFSRNHFLIEFNPPLCRITDLLSGNGTKVNGCRIKESMDLHTGDRIAGGNTQFEVVLETMELDPYRTLPPLSVPDADQTIDQAASEKKAASEPSSQEGPAGVMDFPTIPGYRILKHLGEGGMGVVFQAEREADGMSVALKTILPAVQGDEKTVERFLREASILEQLQHPNIVSFNDRGRAGKLLYFAMEYVPGPNLLRLCRNTAGPFPIPRAVRLIRQVLEGLTHAHTHGFVHRDIKPANVLVCGSGDSEIAKLADFGLARTYQESPLSGLTLSGAAGGTPQFMPPEQVLDFRSVKPAADQYSTAATLYYILTSQFLWPKAADFVELLAQILNEDPKPIRTVRADLPAPLGAVIDRALRRKPQERFPTVEAFRQALLPFVVR